MAKTTQTTDDPPTATTTRTPARTRPTTEPRNKPRRLPPYAVIIENDDEHSFPYVIEALQRVFGYGWFKCFRLTMQAHLRGRAAVWTGPLEVAEFKRDRIRSLGPDFIATKPVCFPLGCTIEPLPE